MYGGTKAELERLIADAASYTEIQKEMGITVDESSMSFDNIVNAIAVVQGKLGIAGATAAEASTTIEGSVNSMKAAWSNLVTGIADENANFDKLMNNFVDSVETAGKNILPRVRVALEGAVKLITKLAPTIARELPKLMKSVLPDLARATGDLIVALAEQIPSMIGAVIDAVGEVADAIGDAFAKKIPQLSFIFENLESVIWGVVAALAAYKAAMMITSLINALTTATEGATVAQTLLNAAMNLNPIALVVSAIAGLVAYLATMESSIKSVTDAQNDLNAARSAFIDAETAFTNAVVGEEKAMKDLADLEAKTKIDSWDLAAAVEEGTLSYKNMTDEQREVYDAYLRLTKAQDTLKASTEEYNEAKKNETLAHLENMLSLSAESGNFEEYKKSVVDAFKSGKISADEAKMFIEKAMGQMSMSAMNAFASDLPKAINTGLDPNRYLNAWERFQRATKYATEDVVYSFEHMGELLGVVWEDIKSFFTDIGGWFADVGNSARNFFGSIFGISPSAFGIDGSHRNGLNYVPYDGYIAELHRGERVLTASEARGYSSGSSFGDIIINIDGAKYNDEQSLASAIAQEIQNMTDRRAAVYA